MIGAPPAAGFISKWYLLGGALEAQQLVAVAAIIVSTLLNAAYFMPIVYAAFFRVEETGNADHPAHGDAPLPMRLALLATALGTLLIFFFPDVPLALVRQMGLLALAAGAVMLVWGSTDSKVDELIPFGMITTPAGVIIGIIGLILIYLTAGYFLGGRLADKRPEPKTLFSVMLWGGFTVGVVPLVSRPIRSAASSKRPRPSICRSSCTPSSSPT